MQRECTVLSSVAWLALYYFSTISHKRHDFRKTFVEYKMRLLIFSANFVRNISHSKNNLARYDKIYFGLYVKYPLFFLILRKLEFSQQIFEKCSNTKFYENSSSRS